MFGVQHERPDLVAKNGGQMVIPVEKYGVRIVSIGFFVSPEQSLIWRGPLVSKGLTQLFRDTEWGETDYMIVDFPPGTGDIQITSIQKLDISGAIIVTTPQDVAINDARKAAGMFNNPGWDVPILGIIENMSWFSPAKHPDEKYYIFGKDGGIKLAREFHTKLLGHIPLVLELAEVSDKGGTLYSQPDRGIIGVFEKITRQISELTNARV
jgi:ATP-binding protein involved in chromosome partitioning